MPDGNQPAGSIQRLLRSALLRDRPDVLDVEYDHHGGCVLVSYKADPDKYVRFALSEEDETRLRFFEMTGDFAPSMITLIPPSQRLGR